MEKLLATVASALLLSGCHQAPQLANTFWDQQAQKIISEGASGYEDQVRPLIPYKSITLQRGQCFGSCPVYTATFNRDGTAELVTNDEPTKAPYWAPNSDEPKPVRHYSARIRLGDYVRLAQRVEIARRASHQSNYAARETDHVTLIVSARGEQESWSVKDYGQAAPPEVLALEIALDGKRMELDWQGGSK